jgi:hypothetical protein
MTKNFIELHQDRKLNKVHIASLFEGKDINKFLLKRVMDTDNEP